MIKRTAEQLLKMMIAGIVPSLASVAICAFLPTYKIIMGTQIVSNVIFLICTMYILFKSRVTYVKTRYFYLYNLPAAGIYCSIAVLCSWFATYGSESIISKIYTFLFFNFKSLLYFSFSEETGILIGIRHSAVYYSMIIMALVILFPLFVNEHNFYGLFKSSERTRGRIE